VVDEPFYAHYLDRTGAEHPGAKEVIANGETDWRKVVARLTGAVPGAKPIFYQKQMTHHLLPEIDRGWLHGLTNCFLIRDPREVIVSYVKKNRDPQLPDLGFVQQAEIFAAVRTESGVTPPVIDARDVLLNPARTLRRLCEAVGVEFNEAMLSWPPGLRATDGIWAKHWYAEVEHSTSFRPQEEKTEEVPERLRPVYEECRAIYEDLAAHRLL
ncbi:MAG TPA: hypothetical protein VK474_01085, partial [Chthoniobacterales bacterium]|nr:hypothetical protein [Chthoniobacterales bacterium]